MEEEKYEETSGKYAACRRDGNVPSCGSNGGSSDGGSGDLKEEQVTLRWMQFQVEYAEQVKNMAKAYEEEHPNVKIEVEVIGSSSEQKAPLKKSIYSLYQLFTIMKAANYRYLEFISSFDDHSKGNGNLEKVTYPVMENERSYRG